MKNQFHYLTSASFNPITKINMVMQLIFNGDPYFLPHNHIFPHCSVGTMWWEDIPSQYSAAHIYHPFHRFLLCGNNDFHLIELLLFLDNEKKNIFNVRYEWLVSYLICFIISNEHKTNHLFYWPFFKHHNLFPIYFLNSKRDKMKEWIQTIHFDIDSCIKCLQLF